MDVPRTAFIPVPNVDSAVVLFTSKERTFLNQKKYFQFLKECFANKRKTLRNNLKNYQWDAILKILKENQLSDQVRAEEIPSYVFEKIFLSLN